MKLKAVILLSLLTIVFGCREDDIVVPAEYEIIDGVNYSPSSKIQGFYLLNEGNMGSNKCTLDYFEYPTSTYIRNLYADRNPNVVKELGDVGNDIGIYGEKLYVVVNCSHKVEILNARTGIRLGQVNISNCRYVTFHKGKAYVSSYVGPVSIDPKSPLGEICEIDTTTFEISRRVTVGYQPEEMAVVGDRMYVANSGGYRVPNYDDRVSVIDMNSFSLVGNITVGINLHHIRADKQGRLWVSSRGNYEDVPSNLFLLEQRNGEMEVVKQFDIACSEMAIYDNRLYFYSTEWDNYTMRNKITYGVIDTASLTKISDNFITDGTDSEIAIPYGIAIHPETGEIFVTDASNYVSSGTLYCFSPSGTLEWKVRTGDIPAHITFLHK